MSIDMNKTDECSKACKCVSDIIDFVGIQKAIKVKRRYTVLNLSHVEQIVHTLCSFGIMKYINTNVMKL